MRILIQRVKRAAVVIENKERREIDKGMCVFLGVTHTDDEKKADWLAEKLSGLRIFEDADGKINLSLKDIGGDVLIVSQFSLYGSCVKGRRPSFTEAALPDDAKKLYDYFVEKVKSYGHHKISCGEFGANMEVEIINDGPLTFIIDA